MAGNENTQESPHLSSIGAKKAVGGSGLLGHLKTPRQCDPQGQALLFWLVGEPSYLCSQGKLRVSFKSLLRFLR